MIDKLLLASEAVVNPEAMVRAAVAANDAASAAYYASIMAMLTLIAVLILGAMVTYMAFQFREMVNHTNGMLKNLMELTDKVSRAEGIATGRQEQKDEDARRGSKA